MKRSIIIFICVFINTSAISSQSLFPKNDKLMLPKNKLKLEFFDTDSLFQGPLIKDLIQGNSFSFNYETEGNFTMPIVTPDSTFDYKIKTFEPGKNYYYNMPLLFYKKKSDFKLEFPEESK